MTTGRINQVNEAFHESCHDATRRKAAMAENICQETFYKVRENSQIRSMFNSVPMTADLTSSEQHFTTRMLHQWNKQFSNTILCKRTTHPKISAESNQTTLQNNRPAESGDGWTKYCWMPVEKRPTSPKIRLAALLRKSVASKYGPAVP